MSFKWPYVLSVGLLFHSVDGVTENKYVNKVPFLIKPLTCVVRQLGESCQMTVNIHWQNNQAIDACLYQEESKLRCWEQQEQVQEKLEITLSQSMSFRLIDSHGSLLAQQMVSVNATVSKRYRRKLKTDWSFF